MIGSGNEVTVSCLPNFGMARDNCSIPSSFGSEQKKHGRFWHPSPLKYTVGMTATRATCGDGQAGVGASGSVTISIVSHPSERISRLFYSVGPCAYKYTYSVLCKFPTSNAFFILVWSRYCTLPR